MESGKREPPAGSGERVVLGLSNVAFLGKMGSGKTTAATHLVDKYQYRVERFAGALKKCAITIWGESALLDRGRLQDFGLAVRDIDENAWCNALINKIHHESGRFVVDDCRFPNEYYGLKALDFVFVRLHVPEELRVARLMRDGKLQDREQLYHESEVALDNYRADFDLYIEDDDTPAFLAEIDRLMQHVAGRQP